MERPIDRLTQSHIEAVINGLASAGHQIAARALLEFGVPIETALRVLTRPAERRVALGCSAFSRRNAWQKPPGG